MHIILSLLLSSKLVCGPVYESEIPSQTFSTELYIKLICSCTPAGHRDRMPDITPKHPVVGKRLIVCCDGTWMNSDNGYEKPSFRNPKGTLQVPSNVTRISRCFKRRCKNGTDQIISYESGVGTGSNTIDSITGGAFGLGLSEVYNIWLVHGIFANAKSESASPTPTCAPTTPPGTRYSSSASPAEPSRRGPSPAWSATLAC